MQSFAAQSACQFPGTNLEEPPLPWGAYDLVVVLNKIVVGRPRKERVALSRKGERSMSIRGPRIT